MIESFEVILDQTPEDWSLRAVYADELEERGDPFCAVQRWLAETKRCPGPPCVLEAGAHERSWFRETKAGTLWTFPGLESRIIQLGWSLPSVIFVLLRGHIGPAERRDRGFHNAVAKSWQSRREAEQAILATWYLSPIIDVVLHYRGSY